MIGGPWLVAADIVAAYFVGLWAIRGLLETSDSEDPSEIVIDEVVGMWIAMLPVSLGAWVAGAGILALYFATFYDVDLNLADEGLYLSHAHSVERSPITTETIDRLLWRRRGLLQELMFLQRLQ